MNKMDCPPLIIVHLDIKVPRIRIWNLEALHPTIHSNTKCSHFDLNLWTSYIQIIRVDPLTIVNISANLIKIQAPV